MTADKATALRKPFPKESIGQLPKGGVMLDYVGHAAVTDRLLTVDPNWSWEPLAIGPDGLPAYDRSGNLWIKLTICGVTRLGVGDGKNPKEVIGDAIRNAAMRFGVALDLWAKENLVEFAHAATAPRASEPPHPQEPDEPLPVAPPTEGKSRAISAKQVAMLGALMTKAGLTDRDTALAYVADVIGRPVESRKDLTSKEASAVIDALQSDVDTDPLADQPAPNDATDGAKGGGE